VNAFKFVIATPTLPLPTDADNADNDDETELLYDVKFVVLLISI
jgi:hypothetical protein